MPRVPGAGFCTWWADRVGQVVAERAYGQIQRNYFFATTTWVEIEQKTEFPENRKMGVLR